MNSDMFAAIQARKAKAAAAPPPATVVLKKPETKSHFKEDKTAAFEYNTDLQAFLLLSESNDNNNDKPTLVKGENDEAVILIPLAPCVYRMTDYTLAKKEPVTLHRCLLKLGVLRCLAREQGYLNKLLYHRCNSVTTIEEDELGKVRFMELLSNCGVYQQVSEMLLKQVTKIIDSKQQGNNNNVEQQLGIPQVKVDGLDDFLKKIDELTPTLQQSRDEISTTQTVNFFPGLGELFRPGTMLLCHPQGMEGSPMGCTCVQSWYAEEENKATGQTKRRFVIILEFIVSVGDELVFVAASDVYPEFHDPSRSTPLRDLSHRVLNDDTDKVLLQRLQQRGEFYASVATSNHYLEYRPDSFFPIIVTGSGWQSNAVRPLAKGGRVMVDVKRGILEGHLPVRSSSTSLSGDGLSDTVKEAIKLWEQSKRTGVAVPFRTAILPGFVESQKGVKTRGDSDRAQLWMAWPMLTGFSFTARVWGKLLLGMPKASVDKSVDRTMVKRPSQRRMGVEQAALGGEGSCGNCGYICFQEKAFEQLVLAEDKKELIRAVARNAGGGNTHYEEDNDDDDDDDLANAGLDVVANKGGASIFLLLGGPGSGKTLTAEAIAELLRKPLYIVTAGDLGITATEVEKTLGSVLDLCQTWDALVLIDEADIFLEARNSSEIQRNALVCVMLRLLEYYSGCLFLSSNRAASSIDAAIASRITVVLGYPDLDASGRAKVWKNLVELVPVLPSNKNPNKSSKYRVDFGTNEYNELADTYKLNGRQIKNSIVLARALARERGSPLNMSVLHRAVTAVAGKQAETAGTIY